MLQKERKYYNRIKASMKSTGVYNSAYDIIIEHAAKTLNLIDLAAIDLDDNGLIQTYSKSDARQSSPELNNYRGLLLDFQKYAGMLGLTPLALAKMKDKIGEPAKKAKLSTIMGMAK